MTTEQETLPGFNVVKSIKRTGSRVTIITAPTASHSERDNRDLEDWWRKTGMQYKLSLSAQGWLQNRGTQIAALSGLNVEDYPSDLEQASHDEMLSVALAKAQGRAITTEGIARRIKRESMRMEEESSNPGWGIEFACHVADVLGETWSLSEGKINGLKQAIRQQKMYVS